MSHKKMGVSPSFRITDPPKSCKNCHFRNNYIIEVSDHSESIGIGDYFRVSGQVRRVASLVPPRRVRT